MASPVVYSSNFNAEDAEVTLESSDGVRFRIHAVYLKAHTGGFPSQGLVIDSEPAPLPEPASILEVLFNFIYPRRQLDLLKDIGFDSLKYVAEAAEKYQVYPAMYSCFLEMKESITPDHASDVLAYALKHDYASLANKAAPIALDRPIFEVLNAIPLEQHMKWLSYYHGWREAQKRALTHNFTTDYEITCRIARSVSSLQDLEVNLAGIWNAENVISAIREDMNLQPSLKVDLILSNSSSEDAPTREPDGDILIECSNEIRLKAERSVLVACAPGFLLPSEGENTLVVPESSSVILRLLSFIRCTRCPDLSELDFSELKELGEAAEKYRVYQAMSLCKFFLRKFLPSNAEEIFIYAARHGYRDILDESAELVLHFSVNDVLSKLPKELFQPWITYLDQWRDISHSAASELADKGSAMSSYDSYRYSQIKGRCDCGDSFSAHSLPIIMKITQSPHWLLALDELFPQNHPCGSQAARNVFSSCKETIRVKIAEIQPLSSFMPNP